MKTILRRRGEMIPESLNLGNVTLNQADYTLRGPYKSIQLGKKEYDIMRILMVNREYGGFQGHPFVQSMGK